MSIKHNSTQMHMLYAFGIRMLQLKNQLVVYKRYHKQHLSASACGTLLTVDQADRDRVATLQNWIPHHIMYM